MGLYQDAIYWGRLGLSLSRRTGDRNNLAYTYNAIASSYLDTGNIKKAIRYRLLALHLYEELHDLGGQAHTHNNLGVCYQFLDQEKALQHYKSSLAHFKRVKHLANTAICHNNVGEVLLTMGSTNEAIGELKKAVEPYENDDNPPFIFGLALVNLSRAYQRKHEYDMAFECIRQGIRHLKKIGARTILIEAMLQEADIQLDSGNQKAAFLNCQKSLKEAIEIGNTLLQSRGLRLMGRIHCEMRDHTQAEVDLQESIVLAKQAGGYYEEGLSLLCLAKLWRRQGQDETRRYKSAVRRGTAILEKMGAVGDLKESL
jgi:tetratricopeptide (TPR) repeat protein